MNDENERHLLRLLSPYTSTCFPSSKSYESVFESEFNLFFVDAKPQDAYLDLSHAIALVKGQISVSIMMKYLLC